MQKFKVIFYPDNKIASVSKGSSILSAAISSGVEINAACGGEGICGKCKVKLRKGSITSHTTGIISADEKKAGIYLACTSMVHSDLEVEVLQESKTGDLKIESSEIPFTKTAPGSGQLQLSPLTTKLYLELPPPDTNDNLSDLDRIYRALNSGQKITVTQTGLSNIRQMGELLRDSEWQVTVLLGQKSTGLELLAIEPGNTSGKNFGLAIDIGTTTVTAELVDLNNGSLLGARSAYNKQVSLGADVITRIIRAKDDKGLEELHKAAAETINHIIRELTSELKVSLNNITSVVCAGNTTMIHLLLRINPTYIRKSPYVPALNLPPILKASEAEISINPHGILYCIPSVAGYLGGDITSGIIYSGINNEEGTCILVDIGTNGEIAIGNKDFLVGAAASAGPAFEGSGLTCGMRASKGAIEKISIDRDNLKVSYKTIGDIKPLGICGSGYINIIAEMLSAGIIDKNGKITDTINNRRLKKGELGHEFIVALKEASGTGNDIIIAETDLENLKRAKAAIYAAIEILIKHIGCNISEVEKVFIAGGFGTSIDIENAIKIGLLPKLEKNKFSFIGNSSLMGAREALLSSKARKLAEDTAKKITYLDLSSDSRYMDEYTAALFFPHTDLNRFLGS